MYTKAFDVSFPIQRIKVCKKYVKRSPWFTDGLLTSSLNKMKLYKTKLKKPTEENTVRYKTYCSHYNKLIGEAKSTYYANIFAQYKDDAKNTWKKLNEIINRSKRTCSLPSSYIINNKMCSDPTEIAESFNNFFTVVGKNICDKIPMTERSFSTYLTNSVPHSFFMTPVNENDLIKVASTFKPKLSSGFDNISMKLVKHSINHIATPLTHIFNLTFTTGIIPQNLKVAKVTPIYKSGNKHLFNNYRPISVLPSFSKLLEKVVYQKLSNFLENNQLLNKHQYGFRRKHSTIHPILHFIKHITESSNKPTKDNTLGVFIDLTKAFDTISHEILLEKLKYYGIRGLSNDWFRNYLSDRKQFMEINNVTSSRTTITHGVPQGSTLGPLLFLIYINDLPHATQLNVLSFADDTTVYSSNHSTCNLFTHTNTELSKINEWFKANKLSLNSTKTNYMLFSSNNKYTIPEHLSLHIDGTPISNVGRNSNVNTIKFLGINFDENLTWKHHISFLCNKLSKSIYAINKVKNFLPHETLKSLYFSLIQSHLIYGIQIWGNSLSIGKVFKLQKRALRIINRKGYRAHTDPLFHTNNLLKVTDIYRLHSALFIYDYKYGKLPMSFNNFFPNPRNHKITTRQLNNIYLIKPRTTFAINSPFYAIPHSWNSLSEHYKALKNRNLLQKSLTELFMSHYSTTVTCDNPTCHDCNS